jgi:hypothetical protein
MPSANAQALDQSALITNGPQASAGDFGDWSARQNVIQSRRYDRLLETSSAFRSHRERLECGPITLPDLRAQCLASFRASEPSMMYGSTEPRQQRTYGTSTTAGFGGGYTAEPSRSTLGAGASESYHTPTPGAPNSTNPPNWTDSGMSTTPGAMPATPGYR